VKEHKSSENRFPCSEHHTLRLQSTCSQLAGDVPYREMVCAGGETWGDEFSAAGVPATGKSQDKVGMGNAA
jgi:hypothetical protein